MSVCKVAPLIKVRERRDVVKLMLDPANYYNFIISVTMGSISVDGEYIVLQDYSTGGATGHILKTPLPHRAALAEMEIIADKVDPDTDPHFGIYFLGQSGTTIVGYTAPIGAWGKYYTIMRRWGGIGSVLLLYWGDDAYFSWGQRFRACFWSCGGYHALSIYGPRGAISGVVYEATYRSGSYIGFENSKMDTRVRIIRLMLG
jgi:hypothetical protein